MQEASAILGSGRSPGVGKPLSDAFLGNPWTEEPEWAIVHGVAKPVG